MTLGDRVAVLGDGRLQQCDTPRELYERPANTFVAGFIGSPCDEPLHGLVRTNGSVRLGGVELPVRRSRSHGAEVVIGLRPESIELASDGIPAEVEVVEELGADSYVFAASGGRPARRALRDEARAGRGEHVLLRPKTGEAHLFDPESGVRLV